ncbi:ABC transporter substrate-binding protein [Ketogulonicigenium vulgare]|uniref:ABC transporter substrate-binding protein n=1 Tax=Ketogulonicigenium vulgare TaxID=92945 RepID=UPI0023586929|nr:ABC transporter substrate-binding protein [Ketogulonicigenium vulgare]
MEVVKNHAASRRLALLAATSVLGLAYAGAAQAQSLLTVGTTTDVVNFNPLVGNSKTDTWVTNLMYPRLMQMHDDGTTSALVATDWGYSEDGLTAWFEIRGDMTWSDGTPLTAADIAFTVTVVKAESLGNLAAKLGGMEAVNAVSDTRVEFTLRSPDAIFLDYIGFWMPIVPSHVFPETGVKDFANDANWVSAGPFVMTGFERGQRYSFVKVENYPLVENGSAHVDELEYRVFPDLNAQALALRAGELDVIANPIPPAIGRTLATAPGISLVEVPSLGWAHLQYNLSRDMLDELAVRQALAHAVDYDAIRAIALQGLGTSTNSSVISPALAFWADPDAQEYAFDPALSRQILEDAGYTDANGDGFYDGLTFSVIYDQAAGEVANWVQIVKDSSAEAGIRIELSGMERNTYLQRARDRDFDLYAGSWGVMEAPPSYMPLIFRANGNINYGNINDPVIEEMLDRLVTAPTPDAARPIAHEIARYAAENVYDNVLYYQTFQFAYNSDNWEGVVPQPSDLLSIINPLSLASIKPVN